MRRLKGVGHEQEQYRKRDADIGRKATEAEDDLGKDAEEIEGEPLETSSNTNNSLYNKTCMKLSVVYTFKCSLCGKRFTPTEAFKYGITEHID